MTDVPYKITNSYISFLFGFQDVIEGDGSVAHEGDLVEVNYVCRRSNGYFVHRYFHYFICREKNSDSTRELFHVKA